jgi:flagellar hook-associated protein 3 FlgL
MFLDMASIEKYAIDREEFKKYFNLLEVKDSSISGWLKKRLQYDSSKFLYNPRLNHVIILGNTTYDDKYVFGGFQTTQPPVSPDGHYLGDDGFIFVQVDEDSFRAINISGREVFDVPASHEGKRPPLVKILENMYDSLFIWDKEKLHQSMVDLDSAMNSVISITASLGARRVALEDVSERLDRGESQLHSDNNNLEAADMVKSALDLRRAEHALGFTLQASSKMLTPSLLEFLK